MCSTINHLVPGATACFFLHVKHCSHLERYADSLIKKIYNQ